MSIQIHTYTDKPTPWLRLVHIVWLFSPMPNTMFTRRTKCFILKGCSGSVQETDGLLTALYPLTQLCYTAGNFEQYSCCLVEANMFCPRPAIVPITSCCEAENYPLPRQRQNQTLLWMLPFNTMTAYKWAMFLQLWFQGHPGGLWMKPPSVLS